MSRDVKDKAAQIGSAQRLGAAATKLTSSDPEVMTVSYGPFTGMRADLAPDQIGAGDLVEAKGVINVGGRLAACWEDPTAEATFHLLTEGTSQAPKRLVYWPSAGKLVGINDYRVALEGTSSDTSKMYWFARNHDIAAWVNQAYSFGAYVTGNGDIFKCVKGGSSSGVEPEWATVPNISDEITNNTTRWYNEGPYLREKWALPIGDWLIVCEDGIGARAFHVDTVEQRSTVIQSGDSFDDADLCFEHGSIPVRDHYKLPAAPVWLYHEYHHHGNADTDLYGESTATTYDLQDCTSANDHWKGSSGAHGIGAAMANASIYMTAVTHTLKKDTYDIKQRAFGAGTVQVTGTTPSTAPFPTATSADTLMSRVLRGGTSRTGMDRWSIIGVPNQQAMFRFPVLYKNRFTAVEGRYFKYSNINLGSASVNQFAQSSSNLTFTGDLRDKISSKDEVFLLGSSTTPSGTGDVNLEDPDAYAEACKGPFKVNKVAESGGTTTIYFYDTSVRESITGYAGSFDIVARRKLTSAERRTVWFGGRAADSARGIAADPEDFMHFEPTNNVVIGGDSDGAITGLVNQSDDRMLIFTENSIFQMTGTPPLDGIAPPDFNISQITSKIGLYKDTAVAQDESGLVLFFYSGSTNKIYALSGNTIIPISNNIERHWRLNDGAERIHFSHLAYADNKLYCLTDETAPVIFIYHTDTKIWTYTERANSGQTQIGNTLYKPDNASYPNAASDLPHFGTVSSANKLYESGDHGGIFSPYTSISGEDDRVLVCYKDTSYYLRALNYSATNSQNGSYMHGVQIRFRHETLGALQEKAVKKGRVLISKKILDKVAGSDYEMVPMGFCEYKWAAAGSQNYYAKSRWGATLERAKETKGEEYFLYEFEVQGEDLLVSPSFVIGDGIAPVGEIAAVEVDYVLNIRRPRK